MSRRGDVSDYAGDSIYAGDLVCYAARVGNRVRLADAIVERVAPKRIGGRLVPMLRVKPTLRESGFVARDSARSVWIGAEHVRMILPGEAH